MDLNELIQALQFTLGKTQQDISIAEEYIFKVNDIKMSKKYRPEQVKGLYQIFY